MYVPLKTGFKHIIHKLHKYKVTTFYIKSIMFIPVCWGCTY